MHRIGRMPFLWLCTALICILFAGWAVTKIDQKRPAEAAEAQSVPIISRDWDSDESFALLKLAAVKGGDVYDKAYNICVVLNRVCSEDYPDSIGAVVVQDAQVFFDKTEPDAECRAALKIVLHGWDETGGDTEWR